MFVFPNDANGDVLRRMAADGADLTSPRVIDFEHCFPTETSARRFFDVVRRERLEASVIPPDEDESLWQVQCRKRMVPTHAAIADTEQRLARIAEEYGGCADGWGTLSNPDGTPAA